MYISFLSRDMEKCTQVFAELNNIIIFVMITRKGTMTCNET